MFWLFLCARAQTVLFLLPVRNMLPKSFSAIWIYYKRIEILAISQGFIRFCPYFNCACAKSVTSEFLAKIPMTPLDSAIPISHKREIFPQAECILLHFQTEILHISTSGLFDLIFYKVGHMLPC